MAKDNEFDRLALGYSILFARHEKSRDQVWAVIGTSLASEAALWVGLLSVDPESSIRVLLGFGLLMLGMSSPLAIRFIELSAMLDRQLLDVYEDRLNFDAELRLEHGMRLEDRIRAVTPRLPVKGQQAVLRRRVARNPQPIGRLVKVDHFLSIAGQPTMAWTSIITLTGATGFGATLGDVYDSTLLGIALTGGALLVPVTIWVATGNSKLASWFRRTVG